MGLARYVVLRVVWAAVVSLVIVTATFVLMAAAPNPAIQEAATQAALEGGDPQQAVERERELRGLDEPLHVRYLDFLTSIYTLEWGWSDHRSQPVTEALVEGLYYTAQYSIPWTVLTVLIGPLVGVYSAANMYSWRDHAATAFAFFGYAIPNFFFGIVLLVLFGVWLDPLSTTLVSQLLAIFLGSSLLVEVVFGIPGLGRLTFEALVAQDTNLVLGATFVFTFVAVIGNLLEDIAFSVLDPRISYDDR